ncbi:MAG: hypothetical protein IJD64_02175 [Clostridia bacterium]|nr:hypothetical protein [Clostridia bacterium]
MKKIIALFLCMLLIGSMLILSSCDDTSDDPAPTEQKDDSEKKDDPPKGLETLNGKTPKELYNEALATLASYTNYQMTTTQLITMSAQGQSQDINQIVITKMDGNESYVKMTNDMDSSANMETWYVDEWLYTISKGTSAKANITWEEMQEKFMPEGAGSDSALMNIPESWYKDIRFMEDGENYYLEFIVSGEEYCEYMQSTALGDQLQGVDDVSYKVYFDKDGNLGEIVTEFDYVVKEGSLTIQCHAVSTSYISNVGNVSIEAPENADSFIDVTGRI